MRLGDLLKAKGNINDLRALPFDKKEPKTLDIPIEGVELNPFQPRRNINEESIKELADSIRIHGLLQPIIVRPNKQGYQLLVGERRLRACKSIGWTTIPAIIRDLNDTQAAAVSIVENLQREDISLFDEVEAINSLCHIHGLSQKEVASILGLSQSAIANKLRLNQLPAKVKEIISREMLSERHARILLALESEEQQIAAVEAFVAGQMNVKRAEEYVRFNKGKEKNTKEMSGKGIEEYLKKVRAIVNSMIKDGIEIEMQEDKGDTDIEIRLRIECNGR